MSMASTPAVSVERRDDARVVRLANGQNLVDDTFLDAVNAALDEIEREAAGVAVVTIGSDKFFSNGFNLEYLGSLRGDDLRAFIARSCALLNRVLTFNAPTVAA